MRNANAKLHAKALHSGTLGQEISAHCFEIQRFEGAVHRSRLAIFTWSIRSETCSISESAPRFQTEPYVDRLSCESICDQTCGVMPRSRSSACVWQWAAFSAVMRTPVGCWPGALPSARALRRQFGATRMLLLDHSDRVTSSLMLCREMPLATCANTVQGRRGPVQGAIPERCFKPLHEADNCRLSSSLGVLPCCQGCRPGQGEPRPLLQVASDGRQRIPLPPQQSRHSLRLLHQGRALLVSDVSSSRPNAMSTSSSVTGSLYECCLGAWPMVRA